MRSRTAWRLALALAPLYVLAAWWPFDLGHSFEKENGATLVHGAIRLESAGLARMSKPPWLSDAIESGALRIQLTAIPAHIDQEGPARILSIGRGTESQDLVIGQVGATLVLRCRRPGADELGRPELAAPSVLHAGRAVSIDVEIGPEGLSLSIDGEVAATARTDDPLAAWSEHHALTLGNETSGNRPWLGTLTRALVTVGAPGRTVDLLEGGVLELPDRYRVDRSHADRDEKQPLPPRGLWGDVLLNVLGFVPLGWLVARSARRRPLWAAFIAAVLVSATMELGQTVFVTRVPDVLDLLANTLGGLLGGALVVARANASRSMRAA